MSRGIPVDPEHSVDGNLGQRTPGSLAERGSSGASSSSSKPAADGDALTLDDPSDEAVHIPTLPSPYNPSPEEVRQHEVTHLHTDRGVRIVSEGAASLCRTNVSRMLRGAFPWWA